MKKKIIIFLILISGLFLTNSIVSAQAFENKMTQSDIEDLLQKPQPRIKIPGLQFSDINISTMLEEDSLGTWLHLPYLGEYLSAIYKYAVVVASVLAVIMIIVAGMQWTMSGGNPNTISSAQKRIGGALIGLILTIGSYTILYTVNPNLVSFQNLKIRYIEAIELKEEAESRFDTEFETSQKPQGSPSGTTGGKATGLKTTEDKKEASKLANDLNYLYCDKPSNPSKMPDDFESFMQQKNISLDFSFLGSLDCNKGNQPRPNNQIDRVILHHGYPQFPNNNGKSRANQTVTDWRGRAISNIMKIGSHFIIDREGTIYPLIQPEFFVAHAPSQNKRSIGIDLQYDNSSHTVNDVININWTEAQYKSVAILIEYLGNKFPKIKPTDYNVMAHGECQDDRNDVANFNFEKLKNYIASADFNNNKHNRVFISSDLKKIANPTAFTPYCEYVYIRNLHKTVPYKP